METDHLEKRFGIVAVEKGFVKPDEIVDALRIQVKEDVESGRHRLIGRILLEQGKLSMSQIDEVLEILGKRLPLLKEL
jgi:hypothetical protein